MIRVAGLALVAGLLLAACSRQPAPEQTTAPATPAPSAQLSSAQAPPAATPPGAADCAVPPALSPEDTEASGSLRKTVEGGPLYAALVTGTAMASCRIGIDSGAVTLDYTFQNGSSLRVRRDASIEYTSHEATLATPAAEDPVAILTGTERASFAPDGCGIDWSASNKAPAADDPTSTEAIYRGDICNCQARIRADASGHVVGLLFRSAC